MVWQRDALILEFRSITPGPSSKRPFNLVLFCPRRNTNRVPAAVGCDARLDADLTDAESASAIFERPLYCASQTAPCNPWCIVSELFNVPIQVIAEIG